jgi:hypothetical protein
MSRKQPAPVERPQSAAAAEIVALMGRVGPNASVGDWTNGNGGVTCATVTRPNTKVVRLYIEGVEVELAERALLAALSVLFGGAK